MPITLVPSGPAINRAGQIIMPMAEVRTCEVCGSDAPFGIKRGNKVLVYCGWSNGHPVCKRQAKGQAAA